MVPDWDTTLVVQNHSSHKRDTSSGQLSLLAPIAVPVLVGQYQWVGTIDSIILFHELLMSKYLRAPRKHGALFSPGAVVLQVKPIWLISYTRRGCLFATAQFPSLVEKLSFAGTIDWFQLT